MNRECNFKYDKKADVLYAFIGKPRPAICEEPSDGILIRRDADTREVIGFTILNYSQQKRDGHLKIIPFFCDVDIPY